MISVQGVCHLFSSIEAYCREAHSSFAQYDASNSNLESLTQYDQMDKTTKLHKNASGSVPFHLHTPEALFKVTEGIPYSGIYAKRRVFSEPQVLESIEEVEFLYS